MHKEAHVSSRWSRSAAPLRPGGAGITLSLVLSVVPIGLATGTAGASETDQEAAGELERIKAIWLQWRATIHTLKVEGYHFFGTCPRGSDAFLRRDFHRFVQDTMIPAVERGIPDIESLRPLTEPLFADANRAYAEGERPPTGSWRLYKLGQSGAKRRTDEQFIGTLSSTISRVRKEGIEQQYSSGARQVSVYPAETNIRMGQISDFIYAVDLPAADMAWAIAARGSDVVAETTGETNGLSFEYERETGFVKHFALGADNLYIKERLQSLPLAMPGGVPVARFIAQANFWPGGDADAAPVHWFDMYILTTIEVNDTIDDAVFALEVPAGTNIVKFKDPNNNPPPQSDADRPPVLHLQERVADAGALAAAADFEERARVQRMPVRANMRDGRSNAGIVLIALNAVALAAILLLACWRRLRPERESSEHPE